MVDSLLQLWNPKIPTNVKLIQQSIAPPTTCNGISTINHSLKYCTSTFYMYNITPSDLFQPRPRNSIHFPTHPPSFPTPRAPLQYLGFSWWAGGLTVKLVPCHSSMVAFFFWTRWLRENELKDQVCSAQCSSTTWGFSAFRMPVKSTKSISDLGWGWWISTKRYD